MNEPKVKLTRLTIAIARGFALIDRKFTHMRAYTYLSCGGPMLTLKVA